jgi:ElaB/YqjD/DUF883 family membrane-anchored ribosome-binding protein
MRFTAARELVVRWVSLGKKKQAQTMINSIKHQYGSEETEKLFSRWGDRAKQLAKEYSARIEAQEKASRQRYINNMKQRLEKAKDNDQSEKVERYSALIQKLTESTKDNGG